jgi:hypothetical protein
MSESILPSPEESASEVFKRWEQLRIAFNVVLGLVLIPWLGPFISNEKFTLFVIECAVAANLAFCTGPVVEGYAALIGLSRKVSRYTLFALGMILSIALEIGVISVFLNPNSF